MDQAEATALNHEIFGKIIDGGDYSLIDTYFTPDFVDHSPLGDLKGKEAFTGMLEGFRAAMPDFRHDVSDVAVITDDIAVWRVHVTATFTGEFMGVKGQGQPIDLWVTNAGRRAADGRVCEHWGLGPDSLAEMAQQMGLPPLETP